MKLEIFESSLCCPSGVCGPEPDKALIELQNVIQALTHAGIQTERFAINQSPMAFVNNEVVKECMRSHGPDILPITLLDGMVIKQEAYPSIEELKNHIPRLKQVPFDGEIPISCC